MSARRTGGSRPPPLAGLKKQHQQEQSSIRALSGSDSAGDELIDPFFSKMTLKTLQKLFESELQVLHKGFVRLSQVETEHPVRPQSGRRPTAATAGTAAMRSAASARTATTAAATVATMHQPSEVSSRNHSQKKLQIAKLAEFFPKYRRFLPDEYFIEHALALGERLARLHGFWNVASHVCFDTVLDELLAKTGGDSFLDAETGAPNYSLLLAAGASSSLLRGFFVRAQFGKLACAFHTALSVDTKVYGKKTRLALARILESMLPVLDVCKSDERLGDVLLTLMGDLKGLLSTLISHECWFEILPVTTWCIQKLETVPWLRSAQTVPALVDHYITAYHCYLHTDQLSIATTFLNKSIAHVKSLAQALDASSKPAAATTSMDILSEEVPTQPDPESLRIIAHERTRMENLYFCHMFRHVRDGKVAVTCDFPEKIKQQHTNIIYALHGNHALTLAEKVKRFKLLYEFAVADIDTVHHKKNQGLRRKSMVSVKKPRQQRKYDPNQAAPSRKRGTAIDDKNEEKDAYMERIRRTLEFELFILLKPFKTEQDVFHAVIDALLAMSGNVELWNTLSDKNKVHDAFMIEILGFVFDVLVKLDRHALVTDESLVRIIDGIQEDLPLINEAEQLKRLSDFYAEDLCIFSKLLFYYNQWDKFRHIASLFQKSSIDVFKKPIFVADVDIRLLAIHMNQTNVANKDQDFSTLLDNVAHGIDECSSKLGNPSYFYSRGKLIHAALGKLWGKLQQLGERDPAFRKSVAFLNHTYDIYKTLIEMEVSDVALLLSVGRALMTSFEEHDALENAMVAAMTLIEITRAHRAFIEICIPANIATSFESVCTSTRISEYVDNDKLDFYKTTLSDEVGLFIEYLRIVFKYEHICWAETLKREASKRAGISVPLVFKHDVSKVRIAQLCGTNPYLHAVFFLTLALHAINADNDEHIEYIRRFVSILHDIAKIESRPQAVTRVDEQQIEVPTIVYKTSFSVCLGVNASQDFNADLFAVYCRKSDSKKISVIDGTFPGTGICWKLPNRSEPHALVTVDGLLPDNHYVFAETIHEPSGEIIGKGIAHITEAALAGHPYPTKLLWSIVMPLLMPHASLKSSWGTECYNLYWRLFVKSVRPAHEAQALGKFMTEQTDHYTLNWVAIRGSPFSVLTAFIKTTLLWIDNNRFALDEISGSTIDRTLHLTRMLLVALDVAAFMGNADLQMQCALKLYSVTVSFLTTNCQHALFVYTLGRIHATFLAAFTQSERPRALLIEVLIPVTYTLLRLSQMRIDPDRQYAAEACQKSMKFLEDYSKGSDIIENSALTEHKMFGYKKKNKNNRFQRKKSSAFAEHFFQAMAATFLPFNGYGYHLTKLDVFKEFLGFKLVEIGTSKTEKRTLGDTTTMGEVLSIYISTGIEYVNQELYKYRKNPRHLEIMCRVLEYALRSTEMDAMLKVAADTMEHVDKRTFALINLNAILDSKVKKIKFVRRTKYIFDATDFYEKRAKNYANNAATKAKEQNNERAQRKRRDSNGSLASDASGSSSASGTPIEGSLDKIDIVTVVPVYRKKEVDQQTLEILGAMSEAERDVYQARVQRLDALLYDLWKRHRYMQRLRSIMAYEAPWRCQINYIYGSLLFINLERDLKRSFESHAAASTAITNLVSMNDIVGALWEKESPIFQAVANHAASNMQFTDTMLKNLSETLQAFVRSCVIAGRYKLWAELVRSAEKLWNNIQVVRSFGVFGAPLWKKNSWKVFFPAAEYLLEMLSSGSLHSSGDFENYKVASSTLSQNRYFAWTSDTRGDDTEDQEETSNATHMLRLDIKWIAEFLTYTLYSLFEGKKYHRLTEFAERMRDTFKETLGVPLDNFINLARLAAGKRSLSMDDKSASASSELVEKLWIGRGMLLSAILKGKTLTLSAELDGFYKTVIRDLAPADQNIVVYATFLEDYGNYALERRNFTLAAAVWSKAIDLQLGEEHAISRWRQVIARPEQSKMSLKNYWSVMYNLGRMAMHCYRTHHDKLLELCQFATALARQSISPYSWTSTTNSHTKIRAMVTKSRVFDDTWRLSADKLFIALEFVAEELVKANETEALEPLFRVLEYLAEEHIKHSTHNTKIQFLHAYAYINDGQIAEAIDIVAGVPFGLGLVEKDKKYVYSGNATLAPTLVKYDNSVRATSATNIKALRSLIELYIGEKITALYGRQFFARDYEYARINVIIKILEHFGADRHHNVVFGVARDLLQGEVGNDEEQEEEETGNNANGSQELKERPFDVDQNPESISEILLQCENLAKKLIGEIQWEMSRSVYDAASLALLIRTHEALARIYELLGVYDVAIKLVNSAMLVYTDILQADGYKQKCNMVALNASFGSTFWMDLKTRLARLLIKQGQFTYAARVTDQVAKGAVQLNSSIFLAQTLYFEILLSVYQQEIMIAQEKCSELARVVGSAGITTRAKIDFTEKYADLVQLCTKDADGGRQEALSSYDALLESYLKVQDGEAVVHSSASSWRTSKKIEIAFKRVMAGSVAPIGELNEKLLESCGYSGLLVLPLKVRALELDLQEALESTSSRQNYRDILDRAQAIKAVLLKNDHDSDKLIRVCTILAATEDLVGNSSAAAENMLMVNACAKIEKERSAFGYLPFKDVEKIDASALNVFTERDMSITHIAATSPVAVQEVYYKPDNFARVFNLPNVAALPPTCPIRNEDNKKFVAELVCSWRRGSQFAATALDTDILGQVCTKRRVDLFAYARKGLSDDQVLEIFDKEAALLKETAFISAWWVPVEFASKDGTGSRRKLVVQLNAGAAKTFSPATRIKSIDVHSQDLKALASALSNARRSLAVAAEGLVDGRQSASESYAALIKAFATAFAGMIKVGRGNVPSASNKILAEIAAIMDAEHGYFSTDVNSSFAAWAFSAFL